MGRRGTRGTIAVAFSALVVLASLGALALPALASGIPKTFVPVAQGKFAGRTWSLGVAGGHGRHCYSLGLGRTGQVGGSGDVETCGPASLPKEDWRRVTGASDENDSASVELNVTSTRVRRLNLLLGHPGPLEPGSHSRPPTWHSFPTRIITPAEAAEAHLERDFRFAVLTGRGNLCVEGVRAFDSKGQLVEKLSVPCEY
jgi:hypothetical protein